jgi:hypothetical protein
MSEKLSENRPFFKRWGWHWRNDKSGKWHKVGIWFGGTPYGYKFYIPFPSNLWIKS